MNNPEEDKIIEEQIVANQVPDYARIYGMSYQIVEHILVQYEEKARQRSMKTSLHELDFTVMTPFPILIVKSDFMRLACQHLKIESRRLLRVFYISQTVTVRTIFALCFWIFVIMVKGENSKQAAAVKKVQMEQLVKKKYL